MARGLQRDIDGLVNAGAVNKRHTATSEGTILLEWFLAEAKIFGPAGTPSFAPIAPADIIIETTNESDQVDVLASSSDDRQRRSTTKDLSELIRESVAIDSDGTVKLV